MWFPEMFFYELQTFAFHFTLCNYHNSMNFFLIKLILSEETHDPKICWKEIIYKTSPPKSI